jgi:hypothetical protein
MNNVEGSGTEVENCILTPKIPSLVSEIVGKAGFEIFPEVVKLSFKRFISEAMVTLLLVTH